MIRHPGRVIRMEGKQIGEVKVLSEAGRRYKRIQWLCLCNCGKKFIADGANLRTGHYKSCGCKQIENLIKAKTKHGMCGTRFYKIWYGILNRCNNPNTPKYRSYGNRGIRCEWSSFEEFKRDMFDTYQTHVGQFGEKNTTIERKNNDGNYSMENCRWATLHEQSRNKQDSLLYTFNGETLILRDWAKRYGIGYHTLYGRIKTYKIPFPEALFHKYDPHRPKIRSKK